nr:M48 family metalloprotease [Pseudomonas cichorii]
MQISYQGAMAELNTSAPGADTRQWVDITVGAESLKHLPSLAESYTSLNDIVQEYREGERYHQFAVVSGSMGHAYVTPSDPHKRIFLSDSLLDKHAMGTALVVSHELSHVLPKDSTQDFAYLNSTFIKESRTNLDRKEFNAHLDQLALSSQSLSEGRENDYIYSRTQDVALRGLVKKDELMKLFEVRREEDIRVERLSDPAVRANLLRRNADSIAALGLFLSRKSMTTRLQSWGQFHPG